MARVVVSLALKQAGAPASGASMVVRLHDGKGEGEVLFSVARGRVEQNGMKTDMISSADMRGPDGATQSIQNTTRTTMTMDLIKQEER